MWSDPPAMAKRNRPKKSRAVEAVVRVTGTRYKEAVDLLYNGNNEHTTVFEVLDEAIDRGLEAMRMQSWLADSKGMRQHVVVQEALVAALLAQSSACIELREGNKRYPHLGLLWLGRWAEVTIQVAACVLGYDRAKGVLEQVAQKGSRAQIPCPGAEELCRKHLTLVSHGGQAQHRWSTLSFEDAAKIVEAVAGEPAPHRSAPPLRCSYHCACGDPIPGLGVGEVFFCHTCGAHWTRTASLGVVKLHTSDGAG